MMGNPEGSFLRTQSSSLLYFVIPGIFVERNVSIESQLAFRYFIGVVHSPPVYPEYEEFVVVVNKYLEMPPFNFSNPFKRIGGLKIVSQ